VIKETENRKIQEYKSSKTAKEKLEWEDAQISISIKSIDWMLAKRGTPHNLKVIPKAKITLLKNKEGERIAIAYLGEAPWSSLQLEILSLNYQVN